MTFIALVPPMFINVAQYGVLLTNAAAQNDTGFVNAIAALPATGGVLGIPNNGPIAITQPIIIDQNNVSIIGFGQRGGASNIYIDGSADPSYAIIFGNTKNVDSAYLANVQILGRGVTTSTGKGILMRSNGGQVRQVKVANFGGNGITIDSFSGTVFEVYMEDVELLQNGMNAITPGDNLVIASTNVSDCEYIRVISSGDPTKTTTRNGINNNGAYQKFVQCHAYFCSSRGFLNNGPYTQIFGGEWETNGDDGVGSFNLQATIIGAAFYSNSTHGVNCSGAGNTINVSGCTFRVNTFQDIYLNSAAGGNIADNIFLTTNPALMVDTSGSGYNIHDNTSATAFQIAGTNCDIHDNNLGGANITEVTGANTNNIHDNNLGAGTITKVGTATATRNNKGFNPRGGSVTQPAVAASTVAVTNTTGCDCTVLIKGGTLTVISIGGTASGITAAASSGSVHSVRVPVGQTIAITYSVAPTWVWIGD